MWKAASKRYTFDLSSPRFKTDMRKTGMSGMAGNKGAVAVRLVSACFSFEISLLASSILT